jgi:hypothetical protein
MVQSLDQKRDLSGIMRPVRDRKALVRTFIEAASADGVSLDAYR